MEIAAAVGCKHDVPDLVTLACAQLPSMTYLHDPESWANFYRFGAGQHPQDNYFIVLRAMQAGGQEPLVGFVWVDPSLHVDYGIDQPWWCINAIAVAEPYQGMGLGRRLVAMIRQQAGEVGVVSIYGLSHPSGFGFWEAQGGFSLTPPGAPLVSSKPVPTPNSGPQTVSLQPEPDHRFFYASTAARTPRDIVLGADLRTASKGDAGH